MGILLSHLIFQNGRTSCGNLKGQLIIIIIFFFGESSSFFHLILLFSLFTKEQKEMA